MAWELGAGLGHTTTLATIGSRFTQNGHNVSYALRNPKTAEVASINPGALCRAPVMQVQNSNLPAAYDCAHMLLIRGYEQQELLEAKLKKWFGIFERFQPDIIVTDHAPTARFRRAFRSSDPPLEPKDEAIHPRRAQWHLHH